MAEQVGGFAGFSNRLGVCDEQRVHIVAASQGKNVVFHSAAISVTGRKPSPLIVRGL